MTEFSSNGQKNHSSEKSVTDIYIRQIRHILGLDVDEELAPGDLSSMSAALMLVKAEVDLMSNGCDAEGELTLEYALKGEDALGQVMERLLGDETGKPVGE